MIFTTVFETQGKPTIHYNACIIERAKHTTMNRMVMHL